MSKRIIRERIPRYAKRLYLKERWVSIVGWEGLYEVSDRGRVRSFDRTVTYWSSRWGCKVSYFKKGRIMKQHLGDYYYVSLSRGPGFSPVVARSHHLILKSFVCPRPPGMEACHLDDDETNNNLDNLRWDTQESNRKDALRNCGNKMPTSKLSIEDVLKIRKLFLKGATAHWIWKTYYFKYAGYTIKSITDKKTWRHLL